MPVLQIRHRSGATESRKLSRQVPLLVGRLESNDIRIEAEGVAPVHCRISWNRGQYEVAAVTPAAVEWNGASVQQAQLSPGDVIRVGDVDIVLQDEGDDPSPAGGQFAAEHLPSASGYSLKPVTAEALPVRSFKLSSELSGQAGRPAAAPDSPGAAPATTVSRPSGMSRVVEVALDLEQLVQEEGTAEPAESMLLERGGQTAARPRNPFQTRPRRPGEQEVLRSPLVLGLAIGSIILLLAAVTIWFVLSREAAQREFDAARSEFDGGLYAQAIESFESFVRSRPRHSLAAEARQLMAMARVEQPISGGSPAWDAGLESLQAYINQAREVPEFQDGQSAVRRYVWQTADRIAAGAAETARAARRRTLVATSAEAVKLMELYTPEENLAPERIAEIGRAQQAAETAILQQEAFDQVSKAIDDALSAGKPLAALPEFRRILDRYPTATDYRPLRERLKKALDLERAAVAQVDDDRAALRDDRPLPPAVPPLLLTRRARTRSDIPPSGEVRLASTDDALFGVDAATGEPRWRRLTGLDTPFAPVVLAAGVPVVLLYDTRHAELVLIQKSTGELVWRLPLEDPPRGSPLVHEGQIVLATAAGTLVQIDQQTGAITGSLKFSQPVTGPPVVSASGERMYLAGDADVLYVLTRRPLGCEQVVWMGHGPGAIFTPPLMMRDYLLVAENDRTDGARLRLFDTGPKEEQPPRQIAQHRIEGLVRDDMALRGKQLVVPSSPERITAFTVAETGDDQALARIAAYQVKNPQGGPIFVTVGSDDQLWMASTALRRFTISRDSLLPDKQEVAVGLATQPVESVGDALYVARRPALCRAVLLSELDRLRLTANWQTSVGAVVLGATGPTGEGVTVCGNSLGDLYQLTADRLVRGGFELQPLGQIPVPEGVAGGLAATRLADGRLALWCGGAEPRLWTTGSDGAPREQQLSTPLEAAPVVLGPGLLLPQAGRLRLIGRSGNAPIAEDLPAPVNDASSPAWGSVAALDDSHAVVANREGRLSRIQYRTAPVAHLAEVTHWDAGRPVEAAVAIDQGRALVADVDGRLVLLDASTFEPLGETRLPYPPRRGPWIIGPRAFLQTADGTLHCCSLAERLKTQWTVSAAAPLAGRPAPHPAGLLVVRTDGSLQVLDPETGKIVRESNLGQAIGYGPEPVGSHLVVGGLDGSLHSLNAWLSQ